MVRSKAGFVLALIAGILEIIWSGFLAIIFLFKVLPMHKVYEGLGTPGGIVEISFVGRVIGILAALFLILGIVMVLGAIWINKPEKCRKGSILVLIIGIISLLFAWPIGILAIIGGVVGIIASEK